jgi:Flp pilus assembly pilin Flp
MFPRRRPLADESGAITVEWVVLSSAVIVLVILVGAPVFDSAFSLVDEIAAEVQAVPIGLN